MGLPEFSLHNLIISPPPQKWAESEYPSWSSPYLESLMAIVPSSVPPSSPIVRNTVGFILQYGIGFPF